MATPETPQLAEGEVTRDELEKRALDLQLGVPPGATDAELVAALDEHHAAIARANAESMSHDRLNSAAVAAAAGLHEPTGDPA